LAFVGDWLSGRSINIGTGGGYFDVGDVRPAMGLQRFVVGGPTGYVTPDFRPVTPVDIAGRVRLWDAAAGTLLRTLHAGQQEPIHSVTFSPDSKLVAGAAENVVKVWDVSSGGEVLSLKGHTASIRSMAFSPDGTRLASASSDGTVKLWDTTSGKE